jgi:hypothetical protein
MSVSENKLHCWRVYYNYRAITGHEYEAFKRIIAETVRDAITCAERLSVNALIITSVQHDGPIDGVADKETP